MTPRDLRRIGKELYGPRWKTTMADKLERDYITVLRWSKDGAHIPLVMQEAITALIKNQVDELRAILRRRK